MRHRAAFVVFVAFVAAVGVVPGGAHAADGEAAFRHRAPIAIGQPGAFVRLPLPASAYAMSRQPGLADLRVVDARGERVPFALLAPRAPRSRSDEVARPADLYPLPALRAGEKEPASPLEVQVVGERITVRRLERRGGAPGAGTAGDAGRRSPGWLFDLGERRADEAAPALLRLAWSGPAEFTAGYQLEVSDDLKQWRRTGGGQLLALQPAPGQSTGTLAQRDVPLPRQGDRGPRFVRLRWLEPQQAPLVTAAQQVRYASSQVELDAPAVIAVLPGPEPAPASPPLAATGARLEPAPGARHYDLGAVLPVAAIDLPLPAGHRVAPVRVQGRARLDEPWRDLASTVFYRIERGDTVDRPPPLPVPAGVRYLRLVPDARAGALPEASIVVQAQLASVVFAPQGTPPFALLAGSATPAAGALPLQTLVPDVEAERSRFGRAALGPWSESEAVARAEAWQQRLAAWRPALLWAVLLLGVGGLAWMVWRLARPAAAAGPRDAAGAAPARSAEPRQADAERST